MTAKRKPETRIERFEDHEIIPQPNPLSGTFRQATARDDAIARAERALQRLSREFKGWMDSECDRLRDAYSELAAQRYSPEARDTLFRVAHDIKGEAAMFGFPTASAAAESLCRVLEHAPDLKGVPFDLIRHHVDAIVAVVRAQDTIVNAGAAEEISARLRAIAYDFLKQANQGRPEHLDLLFAASPSIAPE